MAVLNKTKIYYDAEFTGLTKDTSLISIGFVTDTNDYFYAEFTDYNQSKVDGWLRQHVIDNLLFRPDEEEYQRYIDENRSIVMMTGDSNFIRTKLLQWLAGISERTGKQIQIYTDCYAYDWVLLNDLICNGAPAIDIPKFLYYIPVDLCTLMQYKAIDPDINREEFIGAEKVRTLMAIDPFGELSQNKNIKHNSLWDAFVARECFRKVNLMN